MAQGPCSNRVLSISDMRLQPLGAAWSCSEPSSPPQCCLTQTLLCVSSSPLLLVLSLWHLQEESGLIFFTPWCQTLEHWEGPVWSPVWSPWHASVGYWKVAVPADSWDTLNTPAFLELLFHIWGWGCSHNLCCLSGFWFKNFDCLDS